MRQIIVIDTETTGTDPVADSVLEVAWVAVQRGRDGVWCIGEPGTYGSSLIEHTGPIPPEARAVHHISPEMVAPGAPGVLPLDLLMHDMITAEEPGDMAYAAHNAAFDSAFLPALGGRAADDLRRPWVCTYRCSQHLWPEAPGFSNQCLRYYLGAEPPASMLTEVVDLRDAPSPLPRQLGVRPLAPHRALYDAACTAAVLLRMLALRDPEELVRLTSAPVRQRVVRFGKHSGRPWHEVPTDYLRWLQRSSDLVRGDADLRHTVDCELADRRLAPA